MFGNTNGIVLKTGSALFVLFLFCLMAPQAFGDTFWWLTENTNESEHSQSQVEVPEISEPFFAFVIGLAEGDSLGTWTSDEISKRLSALGRESRFPVELLQSLTRRPAIGQERESRMHQSVGRIWEMELAEDLERSMPYSILGYHPGSLYVSKRLVLSEWSLGHINIPNPTEENKLQVESLDNVMIMRLDEGSIILDVDAWLDTILGKGLDDAWTLGMALFRSDGVISGLAISVGRKDRNIFGEIDFKADKVKSHGSDIARALSRYCRNFTAPHPHKNNVPWVVVPK